MRVLLLRPPRFVWPFNGEGSAFWQPLGLLCLAAHVRRAMPEVQIEVLDCPAERVGWRTLREKLAAERIDALGVGEETVSAHEAIRAARLVKELWPGCLVVAGGVYFAHAAERALASGAIDVVVRGEGEETFLELLRSAGDRAAWAGIRGLTFLDGAGRPVVTPPRELIDDMDSLAMPAYDKIDMGLYGRNSRNHPALAAVEHSRGCVDSCSFCVLWRQMGRPVGGYGQRVPAWRTKSPQRSFDEVMRLHWDFGRRTFGWVDPTFNASAEWSDCWAELMLKSTLAGPRGRARTLHTAWLRADCVVRDERLGVLEKLVRAGLRQVMIGVERDLPGDMAALGKHGNDWETCREAFDIFRRRYPGVYTIGTMIFGLPGDGPRDLERLAASQYKLAMDYCFLMPLTPNPGTSFAPAGGQEACDDAEALARHNFHTPIMPTGRLDARELAGIYWKVMFNPSTRRIARAARLLLQADARKRRVGWALGKRGTEIAIRSLWNAAFRRSQTPALYSRKPSWYES